MGHYDSDYEYEADKKRNARKLKQHEAKKLLRQALELADECKPYNKEICCLKIEEAIFWLEGPKDE